MKTIDLLEKIWTEDIATDVGGGGLVNERTLQAAMYHHLRNQGGPGLGVRLEVKNFMSGSGIPDVVVVNTEAEKRVVEAVIELKLLPSNKGIVYQDDIAKLVGWAQAAHAGTRSDSLDVDPKTLDWAGERYKFTPETSWVFAAIGADGYDGLDCELVRQHATSCANKKGTDIGELNLWLFPGVLAGPFGPVAKL